jgi:hypothetical protein
MNRRRGEVWVSPLMLPCFTVSILEKHSHDILHSEGHIGKSGFVTTHSAPCRWHQGETITILKEGLIKLTSVAPTVHLDMHHQYDKWVQYGTSRHICPWCICGFETPHATTVRWGSAMVLETGNSKEEIVWEQEWETKPMRNEACKPPKPEVEASGPARCGGTVHKGNHGHHRRISSEKEKLRYACRMSSLKEGTVWQWLKAGIV